MAFKFTSSECISASESMRTSASNIGGLIEDFGSLIESVSSNYQSDASSQIAEAFNKVKARGPEFQQAIEECAKYLTDTVAPAYEKLEQTAKSKVEGV